MKKLTIFEIVDDDDILTAKERPERLALLNFIYTLHEEGFPVEQYNLIEHPLAFMKHKEVAKALDDECDSAFPLIFIDDTLEWKAAYPSIENLASKLEVAEVLGRLKTLPDAYFESTCGPAGCAGCSGCGSSEAFE